jgi:alpha-tubulin suppressor-like RCC1 family protein
MDINKRLHKRLNEYFKDNIKLFFIAEENIVIATKEDKVYIIDEYMNKTYGSIIYTNDESVVKELINESMVEELYNKDVVDIKSGVVHTIARTSDGKIYVWGYCDYGVLGFGFNDKKIYRPKLSENLTDLNIINMSCGAYHTLVLTSSGDIYSWGWNQFGQTGNESDSEYQLIPMKINGMKSEKFKAISCGFWNSMALTEDGRVFSCGQNTYGQLGDLSFKDSNRLKPVDMKNVIVEKISCGLCHSVFLSNKGDVYVSGPYYNEHMDVNRAILENLII